MTFGDRWNENKKEDRMQQGSRLQGFDRKAVAAVLSFLLLVGSPIGLVQEPLALADDDNGFAVQDADKAPEASADDSQERVETPAQIIQEAPLVKKDSAVAEAPPETPDALHDAAGKTSIINDEVPLSQDAVQPNAGVLVFEGMTYVLQTDGKTVTLAGCTVAPKGGVVVPAVISSGTDVYEVTALGENAFSGCAKMTSLSLPASLASIGSDAFKGCKALASISVSEENELFSSYEGLLFDKQQQTLVHCPEGKSGIVRLPDAVTNVSAAAFAASLLIEAFEVGEANESYTTYGGLLYSKDRSTLIAYPTGMPRAVTLAAETRVIKGGCLGGGYNS